MKNLHITLKAIALILLLAGCSTTDTELTQKEKDRLAREQQRANQKQAESQEKKLLKESTQGLQRKGAR